MKRITTILLLSLVFLPHAIAQASDCTLYASASGNDGNSGTSPSAPKTFLGAANAAQPGAVVCLLGGTYNRTGSFFPPRSGTSSAWIVYKAYGDSPANITYTGTSANWTAIFDTGNNTFPNGPSYLEFNGFNLDGLNQAVDGVHCNGSHHLRIKNNTIQNFGAAGISTLNCDYITSDHNIINHNGYGEGWSSGISYNSNQFFDSYAGFHNIVANNTIAGSYDGSIHHTDGNGIIMDLGGSTPPVLIINNSVYGNGGRCIQALSNTNFWIVNNTCYKNGLDTADTFGSLVTQNASNGYFINNIAIGWNGRPPYAQLGSNTNVQYYADMYFGASNTFSNPQFIQADPLFRNPPSFDPTAAGQYATALSASLLGDRLTLLPLSPALGRGIDPSTLSGLPAAIVTDLKTYIYKDLNGNPRPNGSFDLGAYQAPVTLSPGTWLDVPNSNLPVYNGPLANAIRGNSGPVSLMDAWNGAAFDTVNDRLIVFGGGHQDYYGNEVYAFSLSTKTWAELSLPSDPGGTCFPANNGCTGPTMPDGQPTAVHTYDTPNFIPGLNVVFSMAGAINTGYRDYWLFDLTQNKWTRDIVMPSYANAGSSNVSGYDSVTKHVFIMPYGPIGGQQSNGLSEYDPIANTWSKHGTNDVPDYHMSATIDPVHRYFIAAGGGFFRVFDLATGNLIRSTSSGDQTIPNGNGPGIVWDSSVNLVVGWNGGSNIYTLDPTTWAWTVIPAAAGSATPTAPNPQGTFSRFQYSPLSNVFVVVNSINQHVYIYKPNFGAAAAVTSFTLTAPTSGTYPFTVGLAFKKGDVPSAVSIDTPNQQVVVKRTWNDGSVKMAIASGRAALTANTPFTVNVSATAGTTGTAKTCANIQTANPAASVQIGSIGTVTLSSLFASPFRTWVSGSEMVECHYRSAVGSDPTLQVWFHVRLYADNRVWVRAVIENGLLDVTTASKSYVPTVTIGGTVVYNNGGATLSHPAQTRWTAEGWIGGNPQITAKHDTTYLEASKLVPNYFNQTPSAATLSALYQTYTPLQHGDWTINMGDTGFQNQIGLLPNWDALYLTSGADSRAWNAIQANGKALNSYPIVFNDNVTHLPPRPSDRPTWNFCGPFCGGATSIGAGGLTWDIAHHGSGGYLAYIVTGDYYYLETLEDQASNCYLLDSESHGDGVNRLFRGVVQDRGVAWCFRTVSQLAAIAPTGDTIGNDYRTWVGNGASQLLTLVNTPGMNHLGYLLNYETSNPTFWEDAPWQQHFLAQTYGMGSDIEPLADMTTWNTVRNWIYQAPVGILGANGVNNYCFTDAGQYHIRVSDGVSNDQTTWYNSWGLVWTNNHGGVQNTTCANTLTGGSGGDPTVASTGYWGNLMPAAAYAAEHGAPGAAASWARLTGATNWSAVLNSGFNNTPMWGITPRTIPSSTTPVVSLNPTSRSFGNQTVNTTSSAQTVTLSNTGTASLTISSIALSGTNPGDFAISSNTCGTSLAQGSSCVVGVTFRPLAIASRSANLTFTTNAFTSPDNAALSGTGVSSGNPAANFIPSTFTDFGPVKVSLSSGPVAIVLKNSGNATMNISSVALTGTDVPNFSQTNNCPAALAANATCTINVTFSPISRGGKSVNITVTSNTLTSPDSVGLGGVGTAPIVVISTTAVDFFNQLLSTTSAIPQVVTLSNTGDATLNVSGIVFSGANSADFAVTNLCTTAVQPGSNCSISLTFTPSGLGARAATLTVIDDAAGSPRTVSVSGTGSRAISGNGVVLGQGIIKSNP